jgi:hypothetical protein
MAREKTGVDENDAPKTKIEKLSAADSHLLPATAKHIRTVDWKGGHKQVFGKFGTVDLTTLTLGRARKLIRQGFKKLTEI